jgi:hypothetical protein
VLGEVETGELALGRDAQETELPGGQHHRQTDGEDDDGRARYDDPATPNTGRGTIRYADRGAFEFRP